MIQTEARVKSITIHGVDDQLAGRLKQVAEAGGTSMNRTIKRLLEEVLGLKPRPRGHNREQFEAFSGVWSRQELRAFRKATADLEQVHDGDWQ
jgi:hypothetical protein